MAGIKIDPEMLDIYMESLNKLMAGSETDGGNARLEVSGAGKTEDGLVRYNEEVNKLGDDLRELYGWSIFNRKPASESRFLTQQFPKPSEHFFYVS